MILLQIGTPHHFPSCLLAFPLFLLHPSVQFSLFSPGETLCSCGLDQDRHCTMRLLNAATTLCALFLPSTLVYADSPSSSRLSLPSDFKPPQVFKNTNLVRNTNLEKGYVRETVNVVVENIDKKPQSHYYLPFPTNVHDKVGALEVRDKKAPEKGRFDVEAAEVELSR